MAVLLQIIIKSCGSTIIGNNVHYNNYFIVNIKIIKKQALNIYL